MNPKYLLPALLLLPGCQSAPNTAVTPKESISSVSQGLKPIDHFQKATLDIAIARESGILWLVRDESTGQNPVSLDKLLRQAQKERDSGNASELLRLTQKISKIVSLAVEQDRLNTSAEPKYTFQRF